jgi:hypothetical protein
MYLKAKEKAKKGGKNMTVNKETTEKKCCFYASDFHLEMTIVPYINKKIEENKNIVIITQNDLEQTVNILISKMNIKNKNAILELDWNNSSINQVVGKNNLVIIINGSRNFVEMQNQKMKEILLEETQVEIVDCYNFEEVKDEMVEIREGYRELLNNLQKTIEKL